MTATVAPIKPSAAATRLGTRDKRRFWASVEDCLRGFHDCSRQEAKALIQAFQDNLDTAPLEVDPDLVYHAEPFDLACDLAQHPLDVGTVQSKYDEILDKHGW